MLFVALPSRRFAAMNASTSAVRSARAASRRRTGPDGREGTTRTRRASTACVRATRGARAAAHRPLPPSRLARSASPDRDRSRAGARAQPDAGQAASRAGLALSPELPCDPPPADPPLPVPAFQPASIPSNRERPGASRASRHVPDRPTRLRQLNRCDLHTRFGSSGPRVRRGPKDDRWSDPPSRLHSVGMLGQARSHPARSATPGRRRGRRCGHPDVPAQQASGRSGTRRRASAGDAGTRRAPCGGRGSRPRLGRG